MDLYKMALLVKNCIFHLYSVEDYDFEKYLMQSILNFMFSNKATKIDEIFTVNLTLCSKRQIDSEDFINFRGLSFLENMNFTEKLIILAP